MRGTGSLVLSDTTDGSGSDDDLLAQFEAHAGALESQLATAADHVETLAQEDAAAHGDVLPEEGDGSSSGEELGEPSAAGPSTTAAAHALPSRTRQRGNSREEEYAALVARLEQTRELLATTQDANASLTAELELVLTAEHVDDGALDQKNSEIASLAEQLARQSADIAAFQAESIELHSEIKMQTTAIAALEEDAQAEALLKVQLKAALDDARDTASASIAAEAGAAASEASGADASDADARAERRARFEAERREQRRRSGSITSTLGAGEDGDAAPPLPLVANRVATLEAAIAAHKAAAAREARTLRAELSESQQTRRALAVDLDHARRASTLATDQHAQLVAERNELSAALRAARAELGEVDRSPQSPRTPQSQRGAWHGEPLGGDDDDDFASQLHAAHVDELHELHSAELETQQQAMEARFAAERAAIKVGVEAVVADRSGVEAAHGELEGKLEGMVQRTRADLVAARAEAKRLAAERDANASASGKECATLSAALRVARSELEETHAELDSALRTSRRNTPQRIRLADAKVRRQELQMTKLKKSNARLREKVRDASKLMGQVCLELEHVRKNRATKELVAKKARAVALLSGSRLSGGKTRGPGGSSSEAGKRGGGSSGAQERAMRAGKGGKGNGGSAATKRQLLIG